MTNCCYCHQDNANTQTLGFDLCHNCDDILNARRQTSGSPTQHAYIYIRVSTRKQDDDPDSGLFIQTRQCIEYCFDNNLECLGIYEDVHSAWNMRNTGLIGLHQMIGDLGFDIYLPHKCRSKNPVVMRLRQAIREAEDLLLIKEDEPEVHIDYVVVANIDRLGRDLKNMLALKKQLQVYQTQIVSACQMIRTGNDLGEMAFHREALEAELFSRDRSMRIKSVKQTKKALGHFLGGRPKYGSQITKIHGIRTVIPCPSEQKIIQQINKLRNQRKSNNTIARILNKTSSKRGLKWTTANTRSIRDDTWEDTPISFPSAPHGDGEKLVDLDLMDDTPSSPSSTSTSTYTSDTSEYLPSEDMDIDS